MNPIDARLLPNAADKVALKAMATTVIQSCPSLQDTAHEVASDLLKKYGIGGLDPDQVYFHRFDAAQSNSETFTGWEHLKATPISSMTLTQLVIQRFRVADQDNADLLDSYAGFYTAGPDAGTYDETNEVRLHGADVLKDFWQINFSSLYKKRLSDFWKVSGDDFRTLAKCNFLIKAVQARDKRQLSDEDFQFVTHAVMGPITWPISLQFLKSVHSGSESVRALDVDGYVATNILRFVAPLGRQIVYRPGESEAFQVLETAVDMHWWMLQRMNEEGDRQAFMTHFSLADRQKVSENITDIMNRMVSTWGKYDHHMINQKNQPITGDAFTWLKTSTQSALSAEAELSLTSNGDLRKKLWIGYLSAGVKVFGPMAVVGWPVALPVIGASIASVGLNIDQAVNGRTAEERKAGVLGAVLSGIDVLFNLVALKGPGSLQEIGPEIDAAEAKEMAELKEPSPPLKASEATPIEVAVETPGNAESVVKVPESFKINVSLSDDALVRESGKFQGTYRLASNPSSAIRLDDGAYYVRYEIDVNGRGTWAVIDPANPQAFSGSIPVRLNLAGKWETVPRLGLRGGIIATPGSSVGATGEPTVEEWARTPGVHVPGLEDPEMRAWALGGPDVRNLYRRLSTIGNIDGHSVVGIDAEAAGARSEFMPPIDEFTEPLSEFDLDQEEPRNNLISDANAWYELNPPTPRLPITSSGPTNTSAELLETALAEKPRLVIGESRGSIGSKQLLIENMPALARRGLKTLYLQELLANVNQLDLDTLSRTGEMPEELENYLRKLDIRAGNDPEGRFNLLALVRAANAQRVRVQAIDMTTTYNINETILDRNPDSAMMRKFFASEVIRFNEQLKGPDQWIALVDQEHMTSFRGCQGISEQTDALSVRIEDVPPAPAPPVVADPGLAVEYADYPDSPVEEEGSDITRFDHIQDRIKGDWRVRMQTPWAYRTPQELRALLPKPGMFTFQRYRSSLLVVYRNARNGMADSVITRTPGGRLNLQTPLRPAYDSMTVNNLDELKQALVEKGLQPMGWPEVAGEAEGTASMVEDLGQVRPEIRQPTPPQHWQANELLEGITAETTPGKFQGIHRLAGNPSTAIMLDDCAWYVRYETDANGVGGWAIIDPENPNAFASSIPVRLNAQGEWELQAKAGLMGGGNNPKGMSPAGAQPQAPITFRKPLTQYDCPQRYSLRKLAMGKLETHVKIRRMPDGTMTGLSTYDEHVAVPRGALSRDARTFFARNGFSASLPPRPAIPVVTPSTTLSELIEKILEVASGLVIGESQDRIASMRFLIENMPTLAREGVKTLYFHRLLNDFSQLDLNTFASGGEMSDDLEETLRQLQSDPSGQYTPLEVVRAARLHGIRVQATDCLASYRFPGSPLPDMHEQAIKTYLTHTLMQADESLNGASKWVALTGEENTNTFRGMAGISELQGGIGLRIEEVLPEQSLLIETDRGIELGRGFSTQPEYVSGDFDTLYADLSVKMPTPLLTRTPAELDRLLFRQGMFTFEKVDETWTLIHRGRNRQIARTLIERTLDGKYLINRPAWVDVHQVPYPSIVELSWALSRMGMDFEGRLPS